MTRFGPSIEPITFPTLSRYAMCYATDAGNFRVTFIQNHCFRLLDNVEYQFFDTLYMLMYVCLIVWPVDLHLLEDAVILVLGNTNWYNYTFLEYIYREILYIRKRFNKVQMYFVYISINRRVKEYMYCLIHWNHYKKMLGQGKKPVSSYFHINWWGVF